MTTPTMKKKLMATLAAGVGFAAFGYDGPVANPDDQVREFSLVPLVCYDEIVSGGFNLLNGLQGTRKEPLGEEYDWTDKKLEMADRCVRDKVEFSERCVFERKFAARFPRTMWNGKIHRRRNADMMNPAARETTEAEAKALFDKFHKHPGLVGATVATEIRDSMEPSHTAFFSNAWTRASGTPVPANSKGRLSESYRLDPDFPKSRVVPEDYPSLAFYRWLWTEGDGWNAYENEMVDLVRERTALGKKAFTTYNPIVRVPPLWHCGCGDKVEWVGHWTYGCPLPYTIGYSTAEVQEMAKGNNQKTLTSLQGISYRHQTAPKGAKVANEPQWIREKPNGNLITTPPDVMVEQFWTAFSRKVDAISLYGWRSLFDNVAQGFDPLSDDYQYTNSETWPAVKKLMLDVAVPLGPLFRAVPERDPEVVVLESYATTLLAGRCGWGWSGPIFAAGVLAVKAGLSPQTIYEDDIRENGIPDSVKVILAPQCEILTETTFGALKAFQARGGVILADKWLVPGLKPDGYLPNFQIGGKATVLAETANREGAKLRARVREVAGLPAEAEQPDVILHVRSTRAADYVFAINDRREAGDYVGQWNVCREKGCPNASKITVNRPAGAVYDLVSHRPVPFRVEGGKTVFEAAWRTSDGHLFLVTPAPLGELVMSQDGDTVKVFGGDRDVMIPIVLEEPGEKPFYGVVKNGCWKKCGVKGKATVRSLADGRAAVPDTCGKWFARLFDWSSGPQWAAAPAAKAGRPTLDKAEREEIEKRWADWTEKGIDPLHPKPIRKLVKPFKLAVTRDPTFDHPIIYRETRRLGNARSFKLGDRGEIKVVEFWMSPFHDFDLKVNGKFVGQYCAGTNSMLRDPHVDVTDCVNWNADNTFEVIRADGEKYTGTVDLKLIELGH